MACPSPREVSKEKKKCAFVNIWEYKSRVFPVFLFARAILVSGIRILLSLYLVEVSVLKEKKDGKCTFAWLPFHHFY